MGRVLILDEPSPDWDAFAVSCPGSNIYMRSGWPLLIRDVFGHACYFLEARDEAEALTGILPVVLQSSALLGRFMTSLPFVNYGGALSIDVAVAQSLMERAQQIAVEKRCSYVEFRDVLSRPGDWQVRADKVGMIRSLPADTPTLSKQLGAKLRSQIKRADRENPVVRTGGADLVGDFYKIFCRNMRDLGTPTLKRDFFLRVIERFPDNCLLIVVDRNGAPAAGAFLIIDGAKAEIPWAACRLDAKAAGFNMRLYWEALSASISRGCNLFDFGRSTVDSGPHRFKLQWGAEAVPLCWHRWGREKGEDAGSAMQLATSLWRLLPLPVANLIGPMISPGLPW